MNTEKKKLLPVSIILGVLIVVFAVGSIVLAITGKVDAKSSSGDTDKKTEQVEESEENKIFSLEGKSIPDGTMVSVPEQIGMIDTSDPTSYILPMSNQSELTDADLEGLSAQQLTYARNEIYARHGRVFESQELNDYFGAKEWYTADESFEDSSLSSIEAQNAEFISTYQKEHELTYSPQ